MTYSILLGTDPELFLKDQEGNFVSAHDLIPGSKWSPTLVDLGAIQPDGVAAEFNTDPAETEDEFLTNITTVMAQLEQQFKSIRPDLVIAITPTATFTKEYFDSLPESAKELGCTPDFNAYTGDTNEPPSTSEPFRTGAGHIHIGWGSDFLRADYKHFVRCMDVVKQLDAVIYFASLLWDNDDKRRTLYGKIGAFRPKPYGVEWRPLSNAYLASEESKRYVFKTTKKLVDLLLNHGIKVFEDSVAQDMVARVHAGVPIIKQEIVEYLSLIEDKYGVKAYEVS